VNFQPTDLIWLAMLAVTYFWLYWTLGRKK